MHRARGSAAAFVVTLGFTCVISLATATVVAAQTLAYSAKFECGSVDSDSPGAVVKGVYKTGINVHNPNSQPVEFRKKAVIANPERDPRGPISQFRNEILLPDEAMDVDCKDIRGLFGVVLPPQIEGFLVIYVLVSQSADPLDVVAKYTARHRVSTSDPDPTHSDVETMHIERVPLRGFSEPRDLTGAWQGLKGSKRTAREWAAVSHGRGGTAGPSVANGARGSAVHVTGSAMGRWQSQDSVALDALREAAGPAQRRNSARAGARGTYVVRRDGFIDAFLPGDPR